ncbi:unnamed protein product [Rotaria socialis]|uniref:G-protein coupled receptors family 1 profile domain-containing protein n=2 Tax=Rotaria socialis TaxID=392032 RepID=A0A818F6P1_9BILA|nr:unnamed protein product [Rotaria socialis]CAF3469281.1 unnamed protein product [Rotaria socialis]CAF3770756.1 unnamed protein product [Rotaria socialis]
MPFLLRYLSTGYVPMYSYKFCKFWISFNYSLNTSILFLNSHLSVERYLLIFHQGFLNSHKMIVHYVPMIVLAIAAFIYSPTLVMLAPCKEEFDDSVPVCGGSCYQLLPGIGTFDLVFTIFIPLSFIISFNCILVIRVMKQKRRMLQKDIWKKNLGMMIQLLLISMLHVTGWMPIVIVMLIVMANNNPPIIVVQLQASWILLNIMYIAVITNPLVCMFAIPEIKEKMFSLLNSIRIRRQQISPSINNQTHTSSIKKN